ncbi:S-protein homolog 6-like [Rutidosis leptorrhynchoides]|uniref:S-protein homolog 6-like n=1 Tax=Rutidosis leptorrhynchoides TaxID=125765 RepID=UPI003A98D82D
MTFLMNKLLSFIVTALGIYATFANTSVNNNITSQVKQGLQENGCVMKRYTIHIQSDVNDLLLHCQSKDDDLGNATRNAGESYDINFCLNIWRSTLYFCHFYSGSKQKVFDVYVTRFKKDPSYCFRTDHDTRMDCYWSVREDGFYNPASFPPEPDNWYKKFDWE